MNDKLYDILKDVAQIWLPATATLASGIAQIWGLPYGDNIALTIMAADAFLGTVLKISSNNWYASLDGVNNDR